MPNSTAICPLDLEVGKSYCDDECSEESVFTVAAIEIVGVSAKITDTDGNKFIYGGLYKGLYEVQF